MAGLGDNVGIMLRIKADSSDARADIAKFKKELSGIEKDAKGALSPLESLAANAGLSAESFSQLKTGALASVAAITAVAGAATAAAIGIFNLAKETSEYGSALFDVQAKTGLSAETLSTLRVNAESAGSSFEEVSKSVTKFSIMLGEAESGNAKANATLMAYGVTSRDTNVALDQAISTIARLSSVEERSAAAKALFKDRAAAIIPVIEQMNGSLSGAIDEARRLGVTLTQEDIVAADKFGDTLTVLGVQASAIGRKFALEMMPDITSAMESISKFLAENKGVASAWGKEVVTIVKGVQTAFDAAAIGISGSLSLMSGGMINTANQSQVWSQVMRSAASAATFGFSELIRVIGEARQAYDNWAGNNVGSGQGTFGDVPLRARIGGSVSAEPPVPRAGGGRSRSNVTSTDNSAERDLRAQIALEKKNLETIRQQMGDEFDKLRQLFAENGDAEAFFSASNEAIERYAGALQTSLSFLDSLENQSRSTMTANEQALLTAEQLERREAARLSAKKEIADNERFMIGVYKDQDDASEKYFDLEMRRAYAKIDAIIKEREEREKTTQFFIDQLRGDIANAIGGPQGQKTGLFDGMTESWLNFLGAVQSGAPTLKATMMEVGGILQNAFQNMANAIGSVIQQWVMYGDTGPNVMKKILASALATIAAEAAVRAIYSAAMGFFFLATHQYTDATNAFISAAVFGSIAGVSALAGRAVAGNSFAQSTAGGGVGSGAQAQAQQNNNFGGFFNGFQQRQNSLMANITDRTNAVIGAATAAIDRFNEKFDVTTPDVVVMAGAGGASAAIFDATIAQMDKGGGASEAFGRASGRFR